MSKEALRKSILHKLRNEAVRNNLSIFAVVADNKDGTGNCVYSAPANNKHNEAVKLARRNHMAWEMAHGHDPHVGASTNKPDRKEAKRHKAKEKLVIQALKKGYAVSRSPGKDKFGLDLLDARGKRKSLVKDKKYEDLWHHGLKAFNKQASLVKIKVTDGDKVLQHHFVRANKWGLPAGRVDEGETMQEGAARELLERTGYKVDPKNLREAGTEGPHKVFVTQKNHLVRKGYPGQFGGYKTKIRWGLDKQAKDLKVRHRVEAFGLKNGKIYGGIYQDGQFGTFGGGLGNNSPEQAAREEYREEGGYILKNVRKIPMPPAHYVWGKADRAQAHRTGKHGRIKQFPDGMMTQYLVGDIAGKVKKAKGLEHDTGLKHMKFYTPDQALKHLPPVDKRTRIRRKVIEYIKEHHGHKS